MGSLVGGIPKSSRYIRVFQNSHQHRPRADAEVNIESTSSAFSVRVVLSRAATPRLHDLTFVLQPSFNKFRLPNLDLNSY